MLNEHFISNIIEDLQISLRSKEIKNMNLPPHILCHIHSKLPEKKTFSDANDILFQALDKALLHKYQNKSIPENKTLILFTWVIPSGLGDLSMQIHIADIIKNQIPAINIELISLVEYHSTIPSSLKSNLPHHIIRYKHPHLPNFSKSIHHMLRNAFSIIEIPTAYFHFNYIKNMITKNNPSPPIISRIGQYGFIDTKDYNPSTRERSMGLFFLEKGIITLKQLKKTQKNYNCYFAYLITKKGIETYILSILINRRKDKENITLVVPNLGAILPTIKELDIKNLGVKKIEIRDLPNVCYINIQEEGKVLIIEHKKNLHPNEIKDYMASLNPFVGVRGDGSFTEWLSTNSLIFYDALDHALPFLNDLLKVTKHHLLPYFSLCEYLAILINKSEKPIERAKKIALLLDDKSLLFGMEKLQELLYSHYSFNHTMCNLIKQNYYFYHDPSLKREQNNQLKKYINNEISLKSLLS